MPHAREVHPLRMWATLCHGLGRLGRQQVRLSAAQQQGGQAQAVAGVHVLAAAAGCTVAKAGNRSVSSACGSADVLEALGVKVDLTPAQVVECVKQVNVAFMFAPVNHPAMRFVAPVRSKLGVRTCFNILGPMTNAAGAQHAVIGVIHPELMPLMAGALKEVGKVDHVVVIHGKGLDEISPLGPATLLEVSNFCLRGKLLQHL